MLCLQENDQRHARTVLNPAAGRPWHEHLAAVSLSATDTPLNPFSRGWQKMPKRNPSPRMPFKSLIEPRLGGTKSPKNE